MAPLKLYMIDRSPPSRSVMMTAKALGVELDIVRMDFSKGEHMTPEFLKMNPQHFVPTLDDNGQIVWDSHAINIYLATKYAKDDSLYPHDHYQRAIVDQRLHFNSGVLQDAARQACRPIFRKETKTVSPEKVEGVLEAYGFLETFLDGRAWVAGETVTLADLSLLPTATFSNIYVLIDGKTFPNIVRWLERAKTLPFYDINEEGIKFCEKTLEDLRNS